MASTSAGPEASVEAGRGAGPLPGRRVWALAAGRASRGAVIGAGVLALAILAVLASQFAGAVIPQDEGELLTYPWFIAHGLAPYTRIWMMYPPATYLGLAGLYKIGLPPLLTERAVGLLARLAFIAVVNRAFAGKWRAFSPLGAVAAFSLQFLGSADVRAYPWVIGTPLYVAGLVLVRERKDWRACCLFVLAGIVRFEFGFAACVVLGVLAIAEIAQRRAWAMLRLPAVLFGALVLYYVALGAWSGGAALTDIFVDPIHYIGPTQHVPLFPPTGGLLLAPVELAVLLGPLVLIAVCARLRAFRSLALALGTLAIVPHFLNTADASHLFGVAAIVIPVVLLLLRDLVPLSPPAGLTRVVARASGLIALSVAWSVLLVVTYVIYLSPLSPLSAQPLGDVGGREVTAGSRLVIASSRQEAAADRGVIRYLEQHARPGQRVFVATHTLHSTYTMTYLYYLLNMPPASRYLEFENGAVTRPAVQRSIIGNLRSCNWIVMLDGGSWYVHGADRKPRMLLDSDIARHFHTVYRNSQYSVLRLNA